MCNCGCNTCETKGPLLTEGKVKSLLSEGLQYHIDKKIPLFETVYRIGSDKHLSLIKEARKMYSRNVIDLCEEDEALIKTHLGEFALYEGVSIPLDLPMLNESYDYDEVAQSEFGMDYDQLGSGEKEWVRDEIDNMSMNESDSNYPDFDLNKNIRYQDTSISSGMWRYTGKEQGGKGVYRNLNNGQILAFDRSDFDIFKNNLSSHFDISEGQLNEGKAIITFKNDYKVKMNTGEGYDDDFEYFKAGEREQVYILDKNDKRTHVEFGDGTNAFIPSDIISVQEKSLNESKIPTQDQVDKFFALTQNETHYLNSKPVAGQEKTFNKMEVEPWDEYDLSNWNSLVRKAKSKGQLSEDKKLTYNNFVQMTRDDMMAGAAPDEYPSDERVRKDAKYYYNRYLQGASVDDLFEAEFKGKDVPLNKPKRGGSKAYYVYVRDPKTKKIKKVSFGSGGLRAKIKNKEARNAFAARHNCKNKKDRTKAGYWSCNLPRYASALGLGANMNTFW